MWFYQRGQTMAEYLVVAGALVSAFFLAANTDCEGYDNCIDKLKTVMHDKYEGYSHSISAVHQYADHYETQTFESSWVDGSTSSPGDDDSGSTGEEDTEGVSASQQLVSSDGSSVYGSLSMETVYDDDGNAIGTIQNVVDGDGNVIGTYDTDTGLITFNDGTTDYALTATVVTDEDGNVAPLQAVVDCDTGDVYGFGYQSGVTGKFYNSSTYSEMDTDGYCLEDTQSVVNTDGSANQGVVVGSSYYARYFSGTEIDPDNKVQPTGEVVYFDIEIPNETEFSDTSPAIGEQLTECAVMASGWDDGASSDKEKLEVYFTESDPDTGSAPHIGSVQGVCPDTDNEVVD